MSCKVFWNQNKCFKKNFFREPADLIFYGVSAFGKKQQKRQVAFYFKINVCYPNQSFDIQFESFQIFFDQGLEHLNPSLAVKVN